MVVQGIITQYLGPTNAHGGRIKATAAAGSVTVAVDHALNEEKRHRLAAQTLMRKFGWSGKLVQGGHPKDGYIFVQIFD